MIADTAVLSTSPWHADMFKLGEGLDNQSFDLDLAGLEAEIERVKHQSELTVELRQMQVSLTETSRGTSVASSECSDELYLDIEGDTDTNFFSSVTDTQEYLSTNSLLNMLDSNNVTVSDHVSLGAFDWSDSDIAPTAVMVDKVSDAQLLASSPPSSPRKRTHSETFSEHKPWSSMSCSEQVQVIEDLTQVISTEMGLREQLEAIQIISPHATVSTHDTEFVIELDSLNDAKLQRIREFVKQHSSSSSCNSCNSCSSSSSSSSECSSPAQKKLTKKQRTVQQREQRQRQRKEHKQMMKEKRSGLFCKEEVLALSQSQDAGEDDVDILT